MFSFYTKYEINGKAFNDLWSLKAKSFEEAIKEVKELVKHWEKNKTTVHSGKIIEDKDVVTVRIQDWKDEWLREERLGSLKKTYCLKLYVNGADIGSFRGYDLQASTLEKAKIEAIEILRREPGSPGSLRFIKDVFIVSTDECWKESMNAIRIQLEGELMFKIVKEREEKDRLLYEELKKRFEKKD